MNKNIKFKVNYKIEILYGEEKYSCSIQDIKDEEIAINIPMRDCTYLTLRSGERFDALYYDDKCIYKFNIRIVKRSKSNNISLLWIKYSKNFKKIQRRKFVRVSTLKDIKYTLVDKDFDLDKEGIVDFEFSNGTMLDLSGSGMKVKVRKSLDIHNILLIQIPIDDDVIFVKGEIKRIEDITLDEGVYGLRFIELGSLYREKIIECVFKIMREQMKKGLKEE